jgi:hypothetical protein
MSIRVTHKVTASKAHENYSNKNAGISFYNDKAADYLNRYLVQRTDKDERLFVVNADYLRKHFKKAGLESGVRITPQKLRDWFCQTMGELGVPGRFVDVSVVEFWHRCLLDDTQIIDRTE